MMEPLAEVLTTCVNAVGNKRLPTYKKVLTDHCSRSLELQSHILIAVCMSLVESLRVFQKNPPRLGKACAGL
jgi:hypothetical protein